MKKYLIKNLYLVKLAHVYKIKECYNDFKGAYEEVYFKKDQNHVYFALKVKPNFLDDKEYKMITKGGIVLGDNSSHLKVGDDFMYKKKAVALFLKNCKDKQKVSYKELVELEDKLNDYLEKDGVENL